MIDTCQLDDDLHNLKCFDSCCQTFSSEQVLNEAQIINM